MLELSSSKALGNEIEKWFKLARFMYNEIGFDITEKSYNTQKLGTNSLECLNSSNGTAHPRNGIWLSLRPCLTNAQFERAISLIETLVQLHPSSQHTSSCPVRAHTQALDNWTIDFGPMQENFFQVVLSGFFSALLSLGNLTLLGPSRTLFLVQQVVSTLRDKVKCQMTLRQTEYALVLLAATVHVLELLTIIDNVHSYSDRSLSLQRSVHYSLSFPDSCRNTNSEIIISPKASKKSILLKKHEVSYLMGPQGSRINFIRSSTGCSVKILSPNVKIEAHSFIPPRNCPQLILLSGLSESLAACISLIELLLYDYHME